MARTKHFIAKRARRTPRRPNNRRVKLYGPETKVKVRYSVSGEIQTGITTSNYGWLYGVEWQITSGNIIGSLPSHTREIKVIRMRYNATIYLAPLDQRELIKGTLVANNKAGANNYWPTQWDVVVTREGDPKAKFFVACLLQDQDGDTGDTNKFKSVTDLIACCQPGKYRYASEDTIVHIKGVWTPQEPTEMEWIGKKADGNSSNICKLVVLATHLTQKGWATPDNKVTPTRTLHVDVVYNFDVKYRGKISTVTRIVNNASPMWIDSPSGTFEDLQI